MIFFFLWISVFRNKADFRIRLAQPKHSMITFNVVMFRLFTDGEPISLADNLESLPRADHFPTQRHRWNTNEVMWFM